MGYFVAGICDVRARHVRCPHRTVDDLLLFSVFGPSSSISTPRSVDASVRTYLRKNTLNLSITPPMNVTRCTLIVLLYRILHALKHIPLISLMVLGHLVAKYSPFAIDYYDNIIRRDSDDDSFSLRLNPNIQVSKRTPPIRAAWKAIDRKVDACRSCHARAACLSPYKDVLRSAVLPESMSPHSCDILMFMSSISSFGRTNVCSASNRLKSRSFSNILSESTRRNGWGGAKAHESKRTLSSRLEPSAIHLTSSLIPSIFQTVFHQIPISHLRPCGQGDR